MINMKVNCFGNKASSLHCKIVLLDDQQLVHEVSATTTGQDVLNVVYQHLGPNLLETAYFGLRYVDASHQPQWLDPNKRVLAQLKGTGSQTLYFAVKFYAVDPCKLVEELTRYQFFLQIKKDIVQGRLPVTTELAAELAALALQSELGDYDPVRYKPGYVSEFRFLAHQSPDLEAKIAELHKTMRGMVPAVAEMRYLDRVKWLDLYGVDLHPVLGEDTVEYFLGLTPSGIIVLRNKTKVGNYFWPRISKIQFKGRYFMLRVRDKSNDESTYGFETPSKSACKSLYKCCSQHLAFFRLVQMSGPIITSTTITGSGGGLAAFTGSINGSKFLKLSGAAAPSSLSSSSAAAASAIGQQSHSPPQFRRMPSRRHQRRITADGSSKPPSVVDECNTSDSDKTLDAASTATLLSPYHAKNANAVDGSANGESWNESSSRSRRSRSRSHSRSRKERRSSSVDSNEDRSQRRRRHRSRHGSDNESEASRASESSSRGSRRRRHRSSRDTSGSESDHSSHRSQRRSKRRDSQGSTYELVDSEAQWREIQERQNQQQSQVRPAAASTPVQLPVQQATVRKATNAVNMSTSSANDSLLDQSASEMNSVVETQSQASSRHRHHRKHHHRQHKHRSHSSSRRSEKSAKASLPSDLLPHLQFELVDPPAGSTSDQLREIPYQVVTSPSIVPPPPAGAVEAEKKPPAATGSLNRKRHRGTAYAEERKIISVDNDSPPPPYSPPQSVDSLAQTLSAMSVTQPTPARTVRLANNAAVPQAPTSTRPPPVPIPGPKPNKSLPVKPNHAPGQAAQTTTAMPPTSNGAHPGSHQRPYGPPGHNPVYNLHQHSNQTSGVAYHQQENNRRNVPPPPLPSAQFQQQQQQHHQQQQSYNGYHYAYAGQASAVPAVSPHHVGLPVNGFTNHMIPSPQVPGVQQQHQQHQAHQQQQQHQQQTPNGQVGAPVTLPRASLSVHQAPANQFHEKGKMALSPLATGVTVTNEPQTKYVTRPKTPVAVLPRPSRYPAQQHFATTTLPSRNRPAANPRFDANQQTGDKFAVVPQPMFAYPDNKVSAWHASLPRPTHQAGQSAIRYQSAEFNADMKQQHRASSLELILSPMVESTLQRKKRAT